ncbi:MAG: metal-binding protein [Lachnospiraceae bacterium]|nr:metal-binding protein [Lachnospiraceae bacterium]
MENSHRFFENKDCKYFPCHKGLKDFNCMFCYCPMYRFEKCPGNPKYIDKGDRLIKDCSQCTFPHDPEHYDAIMDFLKSAK